MWRALRALPLHGTHFRRQVPIGKYVVDFACMREKLIVEIDGGQHALEANVLNDAARTCWLEKEGYRVVRYWNNEVMSNIDGVMESLMLTLSRSVHPTPSRSARRPSPSRGG
jgi:very-short-patch-repair endonuclease